MNCCIGLLEDENEQMMFESLDCPAHLVMKQKAESLEIHLFSWLFTTFQTEYEFLNQDTSMTKS